ncbi:MAG: hypothetical protein ACOX0Z_03980 [Candidatus Nanosyncoccaceae bacterium]|jgi:hypothetical protein
MDNDTNNNSVQPGEQLVQSTLQPEVQSEAQSMDSPVEAPVGSVMPEAPTPVQSQPVAQPAPKQKKAKKGLIIGLIIAILLIGGLVSAYFWYQSPNKVVADAINKSNSAKIIKTKIKLSGLDLSESSPMGVKFSSLEMEVAGDIEKMAFDYSATANLELMGQKLPVKAKMMLVDKKDIYFYLEDISKLVDGFFDSMSSTLGSEYTSEFNKVKQQVKPVVAKIENKWVKLPLDELKSEASDDDNEVLVCVSDVMKNFDADKYMEQAQAALKEHSFYQAGEVRTVDGNFAVKVAIDKDKLKDYSEKLSETDFIKALNECSSPKVEYGNFDDDDDDYDFDFDFDYDDNLTEGMVAPKPDEPVLKNTEFIISKWGHQLKGVNTEVESKTTTMGKTTTQTVKVEMTLDWPKSVEVKAPSDAISFEEWTKSIEEEMEKMEDSSDDIGTFNPFESLFF